VLVDVPVVLMLVGLAAYTVLAGADFGAGFWTLVPSGGWTSATARHDRARHAMGPVWEANHVWLIFVLVVCWTAYPVAFASIMSTLCVPLFIAAVGIILRGASYALRGQLDAASGRRAVERVFALSSIMTPFAMGTVVGAIASGRVPVGNARGDLLGSWLNPTRCRSAPWQSPRRAIWPRSTWRAMPAASASALSSVTSAAAPSWRGSWPERSPSPASWSSALTPRRSGAPSPEEVVS
jgi:bd-type cytochrome oxidase subunit II